MLRYIYPGIQSAQKEKDDDLQLLLTGDLNMFEQAAAMQELCRNHDYTQSALAKKLGASQSSIGNKIRLLQFDTFERNMIIQNNLTERHARALLRILPPKRAKLIETVSRMQLNVAQTENLVEKYLSDNCIHDSDVSSLSAFKEPLSVSVFLSQTQQGADRLRLVGNKVSCMTEAGDGWHRITVTISE